MEDKTIRKLIEKLESYIEEAIDYPLDCMNVGILVDAINARDALIKEYGYLGESIYAKSREE